MKKFTPIFKDVSGYEGLYKISSDGVLISYFLRGRHSVTTPKLHKNTSGYLFKALYKNKSFKNKYIHRLVAEAFIPNPENKPQVNHINGIKTDNRVENLEWCTRSENQIHSYNIGLQIPKSGDNHYNVKIGDSDVIDIKKLKGYVKAKELSKKYNINIRLIYKIWQNKRSITKK